MKPGGSLPKMLMLEPSQIGSSSAAELEREDKGSGRVELSSFRLISLDRRGIQNSRAIKMLSN